MFVGCDVLSPDSDNNENESNENGTENVSFFYRIDLSSFENNFKKGEFKELVARDSSHYVLIDKYETGITKTELFINEEDTVAVLLSPNGFPHSIVSRKECILLGGYEGNKLRCGIITEDSSALFELETKTNWDDYYDFIMSSPNTRVSDDDNQKEEYIKKAETDIVINEIIGLIVDCFLEKKPIGHSVDLIDKLARILKIEGAMLSDNDGWIRTVADAVSDIAFVAGAIVYPEKTALVLYTKYVIIPIFQAYMRGDLSYYLEDNSVVSFTYNDVYNATLSPSEGYFDWFGGTFELTLNPGKMDYDILHLIWNLTSKQPDWINVSLFYEQQKYFIRVTVDRNEENSTRSHEIIITLRDAAGQERDVSFTVNQGTQLQVNPTYLLFNKIETKQVIVTSTDDWDFYDIPDWCDVKRTSVSGDVQGFSVTPKEEGVYHISKVFIEATTKEGEKYYKSVMVEFDCPLYYLNRKLCPDGKHPHAIDLGLSVKWACCDVGASNPLENGGFYAWGETETKEITSYMYHHTSYLQSDYKWYATGQKIVDGKVYNLSGYTKYNSDPSLGYVGYTDNKTILDLEDDAAHANWGGGWRMPTKEELDELGSRCSWYNWTASSGLYSGGGVATGPSGQSIVMLNKNCAGPTSYYTYGWTHVNYWTSSLDTHYDSWWHDYLAWGVQTEKRYVGLAVRPVCD